MLAFEFHPVVIVNARSEISAAGRYGTTRSSSRIADFGFLHLGRSECGWRSSDRSGAGPCPYPAIVRSSHGLLQEHASSQGEEHCDA